jgi:hypothetical protein
VALELKDVRAKLTPESHCVLMAYAEAHGLDASEVVRDLVAEWARKQVHVAELTRRNLAREGLAGANEGFMRTAGSK